MHWIFKTFPFLSQNNVEGDELHLLHLGLLQWMLGSVLWTMCYIVMPKIPSENIKQVWAWVSEYYSSNGSPCQYSNLGLSSFTDPKYPRKDFPRLKGRGGEVKHVLPAILFCWEQCMREGEEDDARICQMLVKIMEVVELIDRDPQAMFMSPADSHDTREAMDDVLGIYSHLAVGADQDKRLLWNCTPKFHWAWHFAFRTQFLHPRRSACWIDEDLVGKIKNICQACTSGTSLHRVPNIVLGKYRWGMYLRRLCW
jgi:hypothetical protein